MKRSRTLQAVRRRALHLFFLVVFGFLPSACGLFSRVKVNSLAESAEPPSNVALYLSVEQGKDSVPPLRPDDFQLFEDGNPLDGKAVQLSLLNRTEAASHRTLILLDISGSMSPAEQKKLSTEVVKLVEKIRQTQSVSVYGYAGEQKLQRLGTFERHALMEADGDTKDTPVLADFTAADNSTNLHGALVMGNRQLEAELSQDKKPVRVGTVLVIARGPDLAGHVTEDDLALMLDQTPYHQLAITVGGWADKQGADLLGTTALFSSPSIWEIADAFQQASDAIVNTYDRYYLLSYCSPARAGLRALRVEVTVPDDDGQPVVGHFETEFMADGFTAGCNPKAPPKLVIPAHLQREESASPPPEIAEPTPRPPEPEKTDEPEPAKAAPRTSVPRATPRPAPAPTPEAPAEPPPAPAAEPAPPPAPAADDEAIAPPPSRPGYE